jgi:hypothetical protein
VFIYLDLFNYFVQNIVTQSLYIIFNDLPGLFVDSQLYLASVQMLDNLLHYLSSHIKV